MKAEAIARVIRLNTDELTGLCECSIDEISERLHIDRKMILTVAKEIGTKFDPCWTWRHL